MALQPNKSAQPVHADDALAPPPQPALRINVSGPDSPSLQLVRSILDNAAVRESLLAACASGQVEVAIKGTSAKSPRMESTEAGISIEVPQSNRGSDKSQPHLRKEILRLITQEIVVRTAQRFIATGSVSNETRGNLFKIAGDLEGAVVATDEALRAALSKAIQPSKDTLFEQRESLIKKVRKQSGSVRATSPEKCQEGLAKLDSLFTKLRAISLLIDSPVNQAKVSEIANGAVREFIAGVDEMWTIAVFDGNYSNAAGAIKSFEALCEQVSRPGYRETLPQFLRPIELSASKPVPRQLGVNLLASSGALLLGRSSIEPFFAKELVGAVQQIVTKLSPALKLDRGYREWQLPPYEPEIHPVTGAPMAALTPVEYFGNLSIDITPLVPTAILQLEAAPQAGIPEELKIFIESLALRRLHVGEVGLNDYLYIASGELPPTPGATKHTLSYDKRRSVTRDYLNLIEFVSAWDGRDPQEKFRLFDTYLPYLKCVAARAITACLFNYASVVPGAALEEADNIQHEVPIIRRDITRLREAASALAPHLPREFDVAGFKRLTSMLGDGLLLICDAMDLNALPAEQLRTRLQNIAQPLTESPFSETIQTLRTRLIARVTDLWESSAAESTKRLEESYESGEMGPFAEAVAKAFTCVSSADAPEKGQALSTAAHSWIYKMMGLINEAYSYESTRLERTLEAKDNREPSVSDVRISLNALALTRQDLRALTVALDPHKAIIQPLVFAQLDIFVQRPQMMFTRVLLREPELLEQTIQTLAQNISHPARGRDALLEARLLCDLNIAVSRLRHTGRSEFQALKSALARLSAAHT